MYDSQHILECNFFQSLYLINTILEKEVKILRKHTKEF